jgi:hypothetical protein
MYRYTTFAQRLIVLFAAFLISISLSGQEKKLIRVGIEASMDCFDLLDHGGLTSIGLGVRSRLGGRDQWFNLVGGVRYIYGRRLSGIQVPVLLNVNLLRGRQASAYAGAGFEFDFIGTYYGAAEYQVGLAGDRLDFRIFFKPYQGDLGAGLTYYF